MTSNRSRIAVTRRNSIPWATSGAAKVLRHVATLLIALAVTLSAALAQTPGPAAARFSTGQLFFIGEDFRQDLSVYWLAYGDFNHDGKLDLAVASGDSSISVLLGVGDGTFSAPVSYNSGLSSTSVITADVDGDGNLDLIATGAGVAVMFGKGNGAFWGPAIYGVNATASAVGVADFNGDGKLDLAVTTGISGASLNILTGRGYGTFNPAISFSVGSSPGGFAVADFNGDGSPDVAVTNPYFSGSVVTVLLSERAIALFPASLTFPGQTVGTTSPAKSTTISNPGTTVVNFSSITVTGPDAADFLATTACGKSLAVGTNCTVSVKFRPSAKGTRTAQLQIKDNALHGTQIVALQGTGR